MNWLIYNEKEQGFWSNADGWGSRHTATRFDDTEREIIDYQEHLPGRGTVWVEEAAALAMPPWADDPEWCEED